MGFSGKNRMLNTHRCLAQRWTVWLWKYAPVLSSFDRHLTSLVCILNPIKHLYFPPLLRKLFSSSWLWIFCPMESPWWIFPLAWTSNTEATVFKWVLCVHVDIFKWFLFQYQSNHLSASVPLPHHRKNFPWLPYPRRWWKAETSWEKTPW